MDNWQETFEYLDFSIYLLALVHNDKVPITCQNCPVSARKDNRCLLMYTVDDFENLDEDDALYLRHLDISCDYCPISLIPRLTYNLYDYYKFIEELKPNINMSNVPAIIWYFIKVYKYACNKIELYDIKQDKIKRGNK